MSEIPNTFSIKTNIPDNPEIKVDNVTPFKNFCMVLGIVPSAFSKAFTIEEQILFVYDFLENTIIPAFNKNGEAVEELQKLFTELKNYIDKYFTNLDVQTEINTKLDNMAKTGQLNSIINNLPQIIKTTDTNKISYDMFTQTLKDKFNEYIKNNQNNSITLDMLTQDVKSAMTGGSVAVVGENSVTNQNIQNKAIDILNLNDPLYDCFMKNFEEINTSSLQTLTGYVELRALDAPSYPANLVIQTEGAGLQWHHVIIDTKINEIYNIRGYNRRNALGFALIDTNNENKVIYSSHNGVNDLVGFNETIRINKPGIKLYISYLITTQLANTPFIWTPFVAKLKNLNPLINANNLFIKKQMTPDKIINGKFISKFSSQEEIEQNPYPMVSTNTQDVMKLYRIKKGVKYYCKYYDIQYIRGLVIFNGKGQYTFMNLDTTQYEDFQYNTKEWIAEEDGDVFISQRKTNPIELYEYKLENTDTINLTKPQYYDLSNYKIGFIGGSIVEQNTEMSKSFAYQLRDLTNCEIDNQAISGKAYGFGTSAPENSVQSQVAKLRSDLDIIVMGGTTNDYGKNVDL